MMPETREEKVRRITEEIIRDWKDATPDSSLVRFAIEWDPDYEKAYRTVSWGFFTPENPRHLDHKTREMIVSGVLAFRDRPGAYTHAKNAMAQGATVNELLEVFSLAMIPGGGPTRVVGLESLRRIVQEEGLSNPIDRPWSPDEESNGDGGVSETREERVRRITESIQRSMGYEDEILAFGVQLDPDYFDRYSKVFWGFFKDKPGHLDLIQRELVVIAVMAFRGMREALYEHAKKALRLGATMEQLLECFEVCVAPGGLGQLHEGLRALKRIHDEKSA
jgi:alkylhydroperoxidase/carboxymuconolactone decarboxylase family protein YurZ